MYILRISVLLDLIADLQSGSNRQLISVFRKSSNYIDLCADGYSVKQIQ